MAKSPETLDRDQVSASGAAVPQRPEGSRTSAQKGSGFNGDQLVRYADHCFRAPHDVLGVTSIHGEARSQRIRAAPELAFRTGAAIATVSAMPSDPDSLSHL